ncbi:MAG: DNA-3-methyladenine glycosylase 2 family protein [Candidatus Eremiobacteraeota bacterium]|nr:DNA-3-methyladenine glycosylase 2 family protein [Candidatus Eremiobacteraeota bacterium]
MQTATARLEVRKPFSLFSTVVSHGWYETLPFRWLESERTLLRAEALGDGRVMLVRVEETKSPQRNHTGLAITVKGENARDPGVAAEMSRRVAVMLHADEDLREFYELCKSVPDLQEARRLGAGRCMRAPTLWEDVLKTVLGTNVTWRQAVTMINRLAQLGDPCPAFPELRSWPSPGQIVRAKEKFLRDTVRAGYRSPYIMELALAQKSGEIDLDAIDGAAAKLNEQELYKKLVALKGVGKSSAHFLMNLLGHYDHLPVDSATYAYATRELFNGRRPTEKQIRRRYARYGKWQSLAYWYERWEPRLRWWEPISTPT